MGKKTLQSLSAEELESLKKEVVEEVVTKIAGAVRLGACRAHLEASTDTAEVPPCRPLAVHHTD